MADSDEGKGAEQSLKDSATQLKESAAQLAEQQKKAGAGQLSGIAGAVHAAADQLDQQLPGAARYIHDAAERIDHAASDLRNRNFADIADYIERGAVRLPAVTTLGPLSAATVREAHRRLESGHTIGKLVATVD